MCILLTAIQQLSCALISDDRVALTQRSHLSIASVFSAHLSPFGVLWSSFTNMFIIRNFLYANLVTCVWEVSVNIQYNSFYLNPRGHETSYNQLEFCNWWIFEIWVRFYSYIKQYSAAGANLKDHLSFSPTQKFPNSYIWSLFKSRST